MMLETARCLDALNEAMRRYGKPEIMNTDQGALFTTIDVIKALKDTDIQIAWTATGPGATTSFSDISGGAKNTKRSICTPTTACRQPAAALYISSSRNFSTQLNSTQLILLHKFLRIS